MVRKAVSLRKDKSSDLREKEYEKSSEQWIGVKKVGRSEVRLKEREVLTIPSCSHANHKNVVPAAYQLQYAPSC